MAQPLELRSGACEAAQCAAAACADAAAAAPLLLLPRARRARSLVAFFRELPVVLSKVRPVLAEAAGSEDLEGALRLREWQETLSSLAHLSNKYKVCARARA